MLYGGFVANLSRRIDEKLADISAVYNFDNGDEFEIAICDVLAEILPEKYGIARGFAVNKFGDLAGDDIIIYDRTKFPTLRMLKSGRYDRKEKIPIEAIYAYIEAKNGLNDETLLKAVNQVANVKTLCSSREGFPICLGDSYVRQIPEKVNYFGNYPLIRNPVFGMVWGRKSLVDDGGKQDKTDLMLRLSLDSFPKTFHVPDLIVAGPNHYLSPTGILETGQNLPTTFFIPEISRGYQFVRRDNMSFASGIIQLLAALDYIQLGRMPWSDIINDTRNPGRDRDMDPVVGPITIQNPWIENTSTGAATTINALLNRFDGDGAGVA